MSPLDAPETAAISSSSLAELQAAYAVASREHLALDVTRGKPSSAQLDLSNELLQLPGLDYKDASGTDTRNYGGNKGLAGIRAIWAELLGIPLENVIAGNSSSLELMAGVLYDALIHGLPASPRPWFEDKDRAFLCPVPGYDRHFGLTEHLGFRLIPVSVGPDGPDLGEIERLVAQDPSIKGIWTVPVYSNPTGVTYSREVIEGLAALKPAAPDFVVMWDNAYAVHPLTDAFIEPTNVLEIAAQAGNPDRFIQFASTSKVTFAGAGVSFLSASTAILNWHLGHVGQRSIGPNKVVQLAHERFFASADRVKEHMLRHAEILRPKFELVDAVFTQSLSEVAGVSWTKPAGGYFVSLTVAPGTARRVVQLAADAGVKLTPAGATHPYGRDEADRTIRIAPSMPPIEELSQALGILTLCVRLAAAEKTQG